MAADLTRLVDVENGHIRFQLGSFLHSFPPIGSLCADLPARFGLQESTESRTYNLIVVSYEDANWHRKPRF